MDKSLGRSTLVIFSNNELSCKNHKIVLIFLAVALILPGSRVCQESLEMSKLVGLDFEVFGRVQGVFFRKYTQKRGQELGLTGWCMNTDKGTVVGQLEGEKSKIEEMKHWLKHTGSPQSEIDKAEFRNEREISTPSFTEFAIRK